MTSRASRTSTRPPPNASSSPCPYRPVTSEDAHDVSGEQDKHKAPAQRLILPLSLQKRYV